MSSEIKELITSRREDYDYVNDLTVEMDSKVLNPNEYSNNYIYPSPYEYPDHTRWLIRYPGATRGNIQVNLDGIITGVNLYDDEHHTDDIYEDDIKSIFDKYIGMKFVFVK